MPPRRRDGQTAVSLGQEVSVAASMALQTFLMAYNFAKRLKTLKGLTSYEFICKCWTEEPKKFRLNPMHHTPGLNI